MVTLLAITNLVSTLLRILASLVALLESSLEAAYTLTSRLANLTLLNFLR